MTISLNDTVTEIRRHFRDVSWSDATLKEWVKLAVKEYSQHFPLVDTVTDTTVEGTYKYDFFAGAHDEEDFPVILDVVKCEFPTGEDPPEYPYRRSHQQPGFFDGDNDYYDVVIYPDRNNGEIWISDPDGNDFEVTYYTEHAWTSVDSGTDEKAEVASHHLPIIVQYVIWLCWREKVTQVELSYHQNENQEIKLFAETIKRAEAEYRRYVEMLRAAINAVAPETEFVRWEMDKYDRIY